MYDILMLEKKEYISKNENNHRELGNLLLWYD